MVLHIINGRFETKITTFYGASTVLEGEFIFRIYRFFHIFKFILRAFLMPKRSWIANPPGTYAPDAQRRPLGGATQLAAPGGGATIQK